MQKSINGGEHVIVSRDEIEAWFDVISELYGKVRTHENRSGRSFTFELPAGTRVEINLRAFVVERGRGLCFARTCDEPTAYRFDAWVSSNYATYGKGARSPETRREIREIFSYIFSEIDHGQIVV